MVPSDLRNLGRSNYRLEYQWSVTLHSYGSTREWIDSKLMINDGEDRLPQPAHSASGSGILWWLNRDAESDGGTNSDLAFYLNGPLVGLNYVSDDARAQARAHRFGAHRVFGK